MPNLFRHDSLVRQPGVTLSGVEAAAALGYLAELSDSNEPFYNLYVKSFQCDPLDC